MAYLETEQPMTKFEPYLAEPDQLVVSVPVGRCRLCDSIVLPRQKRNPPEGLPWCMEVMRSVSAMGGGEGFMDEDGVYVCWKCLDAGLCVYPCDLCGELRSTFQETFGYDHRGRMCSTCYETVPVKVWTEKYLELEKKYRYHY